MQANEEEEEEEEEPADLPPEAPTDNHVQSQQQQQQQLLQHERADLLIKAVLRGNHVKVQELLMITNADVNWMDDEGFAPLHVACWKAHADTVALLLGHGAHVNRISGDGFAPLDMACLYGNEEIVDMLLNAGASILGAGVNNTDRQHNKENGHQQQITTTPLHYACQQGRLGVVRRLHQAGACIHCRNDVGFTPLLLACKGKNLDLVKYLLDNGARVEDQSDNGCTALHAACYNGRLAIVQYLIRKGASWSCQTYANFELGIRTPLYLACSDGNAQVVGCLISAGANVDESHLVAANEKGHFDAFQHVVVALCKHTEPYVNMSVLSSANDQNIGS